MDNFKKYLEQFDEDDDYFDGPEMLERVGTKIERSTDLNVKSLQEKVKKIFIVECKKIAAEKNMSPVEVAEGIMGGISRYMGRYWTRRSVFPLWTRIFHSGIFVS